MLKANNSTRRKAFAAACCVLALPVILSGCMPYKELKDESIVEGMGVDYGSNGYELTFQIYMPQSSGDISKSEKGGSSEVTILQSSGSSFFDAVRNATLQNGRKLYFSNVRAYVIGEDVCAKNFSRTLDFMKRNHEIRTTDHVFIAKGKASDILTYKKNDEIVSAVNIELMSEEYSQTSKTDNVQLIDIYKNIASGITDPVVSALSLKTNDSGEIIMEMSGTGVFHNKILAGYLDAKQTRGCLWITGKASGGVLVLNLPQNGTASMEILNSSSKVTLAGDEKTPVIKVDINFKTNLTEVQSQTEYTVDQGFINNLQKLQNETVKSEAESAIDTALRTYGADIFGFGLKIFEDKPELWRTTEKNWSEAAKNLKVEITAESSIINTGLNKNTTAFKNNNAA